VGGPAGVRSAGQCRSADGLGAEPYVDPVLGPGWTTASDGAVSGPGFPSWAWARPAVVKVAGGRASHLLVAAVAVRYAAQAAVPISALVAISAVQQLA
jgi:hypothetical protein